MQWLVKEEFESFPFRFQRDAFIRRGNAMRLNGADAEFLDKKACKRNVSLFKF